MSCRGLIGVKHPVEIRLLESSTLPLSPQKSLSYLSYRPPSPRFLSQLFLQIFQQKSNPPKSPLTLRNHERRTNEDRPDDSREDRHPSWHHPLWHDAVITHRPALHSTIAAHGAGAVAAHRSSAHGCFRNVSNTRTRSHVSRQR
jgi:hypothetical protein